ncbi:glycoside hydrolase family 5 protein [Levilactobacillus sp. N40-8-2]|uniref:glycoside hydrolase family 5 protein n=1 Tax=Levilactobacillus muriae TaxID=3238987 RepID=UPI0038B2EF8E
MTEIKGVNLGGWLVLEKWMSPHLFDDVPSDDEYYLAQDLPTAVYETRIKMHRAEFITEADFITIANRGFNAVRIPVPYFIFGDRPPFVGCVQDLDHAFAWAEAYGLQILIDLHTVPGSQNGFDNGGISGVCTWAQQPQEVDFALSVLQRLAQRYGHRSGLLGIEVLNEPATKTMFQSMSIRYKARNPKLAEKSKPITLDFLYDFYLKAYNSLRKDLPVDKAIYFHDGFEFEAWHDFFATNSFENVVLDTHQYLMMAELSGTPQSVTDYVEVMRDFGKRLAVVAQEVPVVTGEFSLFNSYTAGIDTKGGVNPTQEEMVGTVHHLSQEQLIKDYQKLWRAQVNAWNNGSGYFFWTYKLNIDTINEPAWYGWDSWSASRALDQHWIDPKDL